MPDPLTEYAEYTGTSLKFLSALPLHTSGDFIVYELPSRVEKRRDLRPNAEPRFLWVRGKNGPDHLRALWPAMPTPGPRYTPEVWLTEGESDAIVARHAGLDAYAVTNPGKELPAKTIQRLQSSGAQTVVLAFDADPAGYAYVPKYRAAFERSGVSIDLKRCALEELVIDGEKDLRDIWLRIRDPEEFSAMLRNAVTDDLDVGEDPRPNVDAAAVEIRTNANAETDGPGPEDWPEPEELTDAPQTQVLELSPAIIPDVLRDWCVDIAERMNAPLDYAAAAALVTLSGAVVRRAAIRPKKHDDWTEIPNLWGAIVGGPGMMKTPVLREILSPLRELERAAWEKNEYHAEQHRRAVYEYEQRMKVKGAEYEEPPPRPPNTRYIINDATVEKLLEVLRDNPNGLLLYRDELTGLFSTFDMAGRNPDKAFYLQAWTGKEDHAEDRIGRGSSITKNVCLSMIGTIQPGPLSAYVHDATDGGTRADGFLQRLQVLVWPNAPRYAYVDRTPDEHAREDVRKLLSDWVSYSADVPNVYQFDTQAQAQYIDWSEGIKIRARSGSESEAFREHLEKYAGLVPSIALLCHIARHTQTAHENERIDTYELGQAIGWATYLEGHARRVYAISEGNEDAAAALLQRIKAGDVRTGFTVGDLSARKFKALRFASDIEDAVDVLTQLKILRPKLITHEGRGRNTVRYEINPKVIQM
jgi:putative DNA primase/helicase